jgi:hypothetical protein
MQYECYLIFHQMSSKFIDDFNDLNKMVFDRTLNDNQIASILKHKSTRKLKNIFTIFYF